jgi:hypothetical protein
MIDRLALEKAAARHVEAMASPSGVTLIVHLVTGDRYALHRIAEYFDSYFIAKVYPDGVMSPEALKDTLPRAKDGRMIFDRLVLSYHAITYVTITAREPEHKSTIGFST